MTIEPRHEADPINPEAEKTFTTNEVFEAVAVLRDFEIHTGFTLSIGRRAGKNAAKGFSTDADEGKIFCPGAENPDQRSAEQVIKTVLKSTLTCVRHSLNKNMPATQAQKSEAYAGAQGELADAIVALSLIPDTTSEEHEVAMAHATIQFDRFIKIDGSTLTEHLPKAFEHILDMIKTLQSTLSPEVDQ
jgi:hypothetical protein